MGLDHGTRSGVFKSVSICSKLDEMQNSFPCMIQTRNWGWNTGLERGTRLSVRNCTMQLSSGSWCAVSCRISCEHVHYCALYIAIKNTKSFLIPQRFVTTAQLMLIKFICLLLFACCERVISLPKKTFIIKLQNGFQIAKTGRRMS